MPHGNSARRNSNTHPFTVFADEGKLEALAVRILDELTSHAPEGDMSILTICVGKDPYNDWEWTKDYVFHETWRRFPACRTARVLAALVSMHSPGTVILRTHHHDNNHPTIEIEQTIRGWKIGKDRLVPMASKAVDEFTMTPQDYAEMGPGLAIRFFDVPVIKFDDLESEDHDPDCDIIGCCN